MILTLIFHYLNGDGIGIQPCGNQIDEVLDDIIIVSRLIDGMLLVR